MVTTLCAGDKIYFDDSVTLTLLAVEGDLIQVKVESSKPGSPLSSVAAEGRNERAYTYNWWELN
jgi:hypothetical protein